MAEATVAQRVSCLSTNNSMKISKSSQDSLLLNDKITQILGRLFDLKNRT
jgi:hypothetical protein